MSEHVKPLPEQAEPLVVIPDISQLTLDNFLAKWGRTILQPPEFKKQHAQELWEFNATHYQTDRHHNINHARVTLWAGMQFADFCELYGTRVNRLALYMATLGHDVDKDEVVSAKLTVDRAKQLAFPGKIAASTLHTSSHAIIATKFGVQPVTLEEIICVRSDLYPIGAANEAAAFHDTGHLWEEYREKQLARDKTPDDLAFGRVCVQRLAGPLGYDLSLGQHDAGKWQKRALGYVARLEAMVESEAERRSENIAGAPFSPLFERPPFI